MSNMERDLSRSAAFPMLMRKVNAAEQLAQAEAKLEEARRLKAEAEAAMNATKQEGTDGE